MQNADSGAAAVTYNTAVGAYALKGSGTPGNNTGTTNTAIGNYALAANTSGSNNVAVGGGTSTTAALASNASSSYNTALGAAALRQATANYNTAIGEEALTNDSTGNSNVALGYQAGAAGTANTTGSNNTFIGYQAQANANNYSNSTALGSGAVVGASNSLVLGSGVNVGIGNSAPGALLDLGLAGTTLGVVRLAGGSGGSGNVTIQPANAAGTWTMTLPAAAGASGQVLKTDGTGITSWTAVNSTACSNALTYAGTTNVDWSVCPVQTMTFGAGNVIFTFANPTTGGRYVLAIKQDATGSRTVTWPGTVRWPGGTAPTITTTASKTDYIGFIYNGTNYDAVAISQNF